MFSLMRDQPNEEMDAFTFYEMQTARLLNRGNAYAEIERDGQGRPVALWPIDPSRVQLWRLPSTIAEIGKAAGVVTDPVTGKHATSHDIGRRAFAVRNGQQLSMSELADWMRHASPQTTMNYYHASSAEKLAGRVWNKADG